MTCRICLEPDNLISICGCKGTSEFVHRECILHWIKIKKNKTCELCQQYLQIEEPKPALKIEPYIINTIWLLFGYFISCLHGLLLWRHVKSYKGEFFSVVLLSLLTNVIIGVMYVYSFWCTYLLKRIAIATWSLCFLIFSVTCMKVNHTSFCIDVVIDYTITSICFIILIIITIIKQYNI